MSPRYYLNEGGTIAANLGSTIKMTERAKILADAAEVIAGPRQAEYGDPVASHIAIADMYNAAKGAKIMTGADVGLLMRLLKIRRSAITPTHRDSYVDECGYSAICYDIAMFEAGA